MGILDGIVEWIAEQIMAGLDLVTTSVLGALGCDMSVFLRYFPAAETMYGIFVALAVGLILLNWVRSLFLPHQRPSGRSVAGLAMRSCQNCAAQWHFTTGPYEQRCEPCC